MANLVGKTVEWTSQAGSYTKTKRGEVIADVGVSTTELKHTLSDLPEDVARELKEAPTFRLKFNPDEGFQNGVIVKVFPKSSSRVPRYYAPLRHKLRVVG